MPGKASYIETGRPDPYRQPAVGDASFGLEGGGAKYPAFWDAYPVWIAGGSDALVPLALAEELALVLDLDVHRSWSSGQSLQRAADLSLWGR